MGNDKYSELIQTLRKTEISILSFCFLYFFAIFLVADRPDLPVARKQIDFLMRQGFPYQARNLINEFIEEDHERGEKNALSPNLLVGKTNDNKVFHYNRNTKTWIAYSRDVSAIESISTDGHYRSSNQLNAPTLREVKKSWDLLASIDRICMATHVYEVAIEILLPNLWGLSSATNNFEKPFLSRNQNKAVKFNNIIRLSPDDTANDGELIRLKPKLVKLTNKDFLNDLNGFLNINGQTDIAGFDYALAVEGIWQIDTLSKLFPGYIVTSTERAKLEQNFHESFPIGSNPVHDNPIDPEKNLRSLQWKPAVLIPIKIKCWGASLLNKIVPPEKFYNYSYLEKDKMSFESLFVELNSIVSEKAGLDLKVSEIFSYIDILEKSKSEKKLTIFGESRSLKEVLLGGSIILIFFQIYFNLYFRCLPNRNESAGVVIIENSFWTLFQNDTFSKIYSIVFIYIPFLVISVGIIIENSSNNLIRLACAIVSFSLSLLTTIKYLNLNKIALPSKEVPPIKISSTGNNKVKNKKSKK